jgi:hypothetical protein
MMANPTNPFTAPISATVNRGGAKGALAVLESKRQDLTMDYQLDRLTREDYLEMMIDLAEVEQELDLK